VAKKIAHRYKQEVSDHKRMDDALNLLFQARIVTTVQIILGLVLSAVDHGKPGWMDDIVKEGNVFD